MMHPAFLEIYMPKPFCFETDKNNKWMIYGPIFVEYDISKCVINVEYNYQEP